MILVLLVVPALVAVQHDVAKLVAAFKRGLRFRLNGVRVLMALGLTGVLAWLGATLGAVAVTGAVPQILLRHELDGLGALQGAFVLFVAGAAVLTLGLYLLGGVLRLAGGTRA
jgi:hypothetical protein